MSKKPRRFPPDAFQNLFHPKSIAVIGASADDRKPGGRVIKAIRDHGYAGKLWAVNPKPGAILGLPTFAAIGELPEAPCLAIVAIPAALVVEAVKALARRGAGAVMVLTSGFGEKDATGKQNEQKMLDICQRNAMTLIGPNCSGFLTRTYKGKFAGIIPSQAGAAVDFISGSGATVDYVMELATTRGLSFGNVVNLGNSVQVGVEEMVAMFDEHFSPDSARILMLYMESVKQPSLLLHHARSMASKGCVIVGIKAGVTTAGQRAAASHTGAMASSDTAVQALFEKAGIIRVASRAELIDVACVLAVGRGRIGRQRACVITDAGGPGVMLSDELNRQGWQLPVLRNATQRKIRAVLPPEAAVGNPIDCLPSRNAAQIGAILQILADAEKDNIDIIAVVSGDSGMSDNTGIYREIQKAMAHHPLPILPVLSPVVSSRDKIAAFAASGSVYFTDEVALARALGQISNTPAPEASVTLTSGYDRETVARLLATGCDAALPPETVHAVLSAAGFSLPDQCVVTERAALDEACRQTGYPLVMKVIGPLHKTDAGGVRPGIGSVKAAAAAWDELMAIPDARGVLVQPMVAGLEVIIGATREAGFGHLLMFGLGGIHAEVFNDTAFCLAPASADESRRMIRRIRSFSVVEGVRGQAGMSIEHLSDSIERLGRLVTDFPQIAAIDLNPIKGIGDNLVIVDARILLDSSEAA
jgi:acyl-CoA synthetase (NDP forming)